MPKRDRSWEREATRAGPMPTARPTMEYTAETAPAQVNPNVVPRPPMPTPDPAPAALAARTPRAPAPAGDAPAHDAAAALAQARAFAQRRPTLQLNPHTLDHDRLADERLVMLREPDSERSAAYRVLRHRLISQYAPQVLVVSSPIAQERKTTCALNLALALGEHRRARVLLLEANFNAPAVAHILGIQPAACFSNQVTLHQTDSTEPWYVEEILPSGLHVLAVDPNARKTSRLDARAFSTAVRQFRMAGYDHLIIDAPPVLRSAEVNVLQEPADGVLMCARKGRSTSKQLRASIEQLLPNSVLGVVLTED